MRGSAIGTIPWVGFQVGRTLLAVEARLVRGVAWNRDLMFVPFARRQVAGILVREGRVVPVFDLAMVPAAWNSVPAPGGGQVVILGDGEMEAGILADAAGTFTSGPPGPGPAAEAAPAAVREAMLSGVLEANGLTYGVLSVPAALQAAGVPRTFPG